MDVINLFDQHSNNYKLRLRQLYRRLDSTNLTWEVDPKTRSDFFTKAQYEFVQVLCLKKQISESEVVKFLSLSPQQVSAFQEERFKLTDQEFFSVCTFLGGANEVSKFLEKLECAMTPGLREARRAALETMKIYGIRLADDELK